ncbi:microfibril-associated glycoprotein 4-like [Spea bombifrons]|uniref:microfibril-associated glycoprotein 4-like n=1 Tax=Spea bombifrons TaxID=233779 RepID=UPI00234ACB70|nr:microfibril-associated glycoprotein 4-like [Spea bombifrons]
MRRDSDQSRQTGTDFWGQSLEVVVPVPGSCFNGTEHKNESIKLSGKRRGSELVHQPQADRGGSTHNAEPRTVLQSRVHRMQSLELHYRARLHHPHPSLARASRNIPLILIVSINDVSAVTGGFQPQSPDSEETPFGLRALKLGGLSRQRQPLYGDNKRGTQNVSILVLCLLCHVLPISGNPANQLPGSPRDSLGHRHSTNGGGFPLDCQDVWERGFHVDGEYLIYLQGPRHPLPVYCDMTTNGTAWTVLQKRFNGSMDFNRDWKNYLNGFGNADGEYWLGLQNVYRLAMLGDYELRVELEDFEGRRVSAQYSDFSLSRHALNPDSDGYRLHVAGFTDEGAGDALTFHVGQSFSTYDRDRDGDIQNCAEYWGGGFWYHGGGCSHAALNARYLSPRAAVAPSFSWNTWIDFPQSLKGSQMKMRRRNPRSSNGGRS